MLSSEFKLLAAFLQSPSKELYARQIERMTKTNHERAGVYLASLVKQKVLLREKKGKQVFYSLNRRNYIIEKTMAIVELEKAHAFLKDNTEGFIAYDTITRVVKEYRTSIYFVLLFGSVARGHQRKESDIDLLFVLLENGKTKDKIEEIGKKQEIITGRKISIQAVTLDVIQRLWHKEPVYKNIWQEKIVFFGEENFWNFLLTEGEP